MTDLPYADVDLSALLILTQLKLHMPQYKYSYRGTSAVSVAHRPSPLPVRTANTETLLTPAHALFYNVCILRITEPLHVSALTPSSRSWHQHFIKTYRASTAIHVQPWTGPECSSRLRLPDFKTVVMVVGPTHRRPLPPRKYSWYSFLLRQSRSQGHSAAGRIMSMKNSSDTIRNHTRDLPACSAVL